MLGWIIAVIIWGVVWGFATDSVIHNKGYDENWFWWGFFFGFTALIVATSKPENVTYYNTPETSMLSKIAYEENNKKVLNNGGWKCSCGKINPDYTGTCGCGRTKPNVSTIKKQEKPKEKSSESQKEESLRLDNLKKLKELADDGVITSEEFELKRKQILNL